MTPLPQIVGYAAVFNRLTSERFGEVHGFREEIQPGAFTELLAGTPDVRAFYSHDEARILGRTKSGTLRLREDERGLFAEITPPATQLGRDTVTEIRRGDLSGMSLRFGKVKDSYRREGGQVIRTIHKVGRLVEVSPVALPAYEDTQVSLRSLHSGNQSLSLPDRYRLRRLEAWEYGEPVVPAPRVSLDAARLRLAAA